MELCEICGEWVNWNDTNINYTGHTCDEAKLIKIGATSRFVKSMREPFNPNPQKGEESVTESFDSNVFKKSYIKPFAPNELDGKVLTIIVEELEGHTIIAGYEESTETMYILSTKHGEVK